MWEVWYDDEKVGEYPELHLALQAVAGWGDRCELRRTVDPADLASVTASVT